jgi:acid phosphatase (class A)
MRKLIALFALLACFNILAADAAEKGPFADASAVDLVALLPPPPPRDSAQTRAEIGELLTMQVTRTPEMLAHAEADDEESVWRFAGDLFGPKFREENLPKFAAFFDRVNETAGAVVAPAKAAFGRPRPHLVSDLVRPAVPLSSTGAYPSGHTTFGTMAGIILAAMVPERRAEIKARAWDYGRSRLIVGIHYPSDVEMGRIAGTVIAATIMRQADFKAEFSAARTELRAALGL